MSDSIKDDLRGLLVMIEVLAICDGQPKEGDHDYWKLKYEVVFKAHSSRIKPMLVKLGIDFDWYDPDTSYEADVRYYRDGLEGLRHNVIDLIGVPG